MKLSERKEELQKEFDLKQERRNAILEEGKKLQQELSAVDSEIVKLQGAYQEIEKLIGDEPKESDDSKEKKTSKQ